MKTVNYSRKSVRFEEEVEWPEGNIDDVINYLYSIRETYKDCHEVSIDSRWTDYEDCHYEVTGCRWETDEEMKERIEYEEEEYENYLKEEIKKKEEVAQKKRDKKIRLLEEQRRIAKKIKELSDIDLEGK